MHKVTKLLVTTFFALLLVIIYRTFQDYGITWDEEWHREYGKAIMNWYLSGFKDATATHTFLYYGGFFDLLAQVLASLSPWDYFETRHLLGSLFGFWTLFMSFKIAQHISGYLAGFFTVLFLSLHPVFYGHMFNNPVDIPFAALLLTTIYSLLSTYDNLPSLSAKNLLKIGIPLGLMLGVRVGGLMVILPYILVLWFLWFENQGNRDRNNDTKSKKKTFTDLLRDLAWILVIAWPVMLLWWPWAQLNPLVNPLKAIFTAAQWDTSRNMPVFFEGNYFTPLTLPKSYMLRLILLTLPEFFFMTLFIGGTLSTFSIIRESANASKRAKIMFLIFAFIFPLLTASLLTQRFDGYRHFLFTVPLLAILSGLSFQALFESGVARWVKIFSGIAVVFSLVLTFSDMVGLHPYETVYFNRIQAGGLDEAAKKYETDYWGNSYREGLQWVIENYKPAFKRKIRVINSCHAVQISSYLTKTPALRDRFELTPVDPDIYLSTTRWGLHRAVPGKILYQVKRGSTPLLYVIEVEKKRA